MSPELFPKYLKDTSLLYRISYEELKTLVVQYPYCQNLRYLLLVKSKMDGNVEQERNLKMASAYSQDRTQLYLLLKKDLKEVQKDFEFLDLNHAVTDDNHPELELPVLDFSNGIEAKEKKESSKMEELDLSQVSEQINTKKSIEEETPIFSKDNTEDDILVQEGYDTEDDLFSLFEDEEDEPSDIFEESKVSDELVNAGTEITDTWSSPLVPPNIDFVFVEAESELEEAIQVENRFVLPLVPPIVDIVFSEVILETKTEVVPQEPFTFSMVPPTVDLSFIATVEEIVELVEDRNEVDFENSFNYPLVPPMHGVSFETLEENDVVIGKEVVSKSILETENIIEDSLDESSFGDEIDQSIQAALARLANQQRIEIEQEDAEHDARISEMVKKKMLLEGIIETEEEFDLAAKSEVKVVEEEIIELKEEKTIEIDDTKVIEEEVIETPIKASGPMPKASFNSWLKQMEAPAPKLKYKKAKESKKGKKKDASATEGYFSKTKKKKKGKKKKRKIVENEGSLLLKAIKARQQQQAKVESKILLVRKKKVIAHAERSLKENEEIVSETLAKILLIQGKKSKAEHMYRKLMLKFPKKSSYFAAVIEKILK